MPSPPDVVSRYCAAAESGDLDAVLDCFTTEITDVEQVGETVHVVHTHLEGDFSGGVVDLAQRFTATGGLISDLEI